MTTVGVKGLITHSLSSRCDIQWSFANTAVVDVDFVKCWTRVHRRRTGHIWPIIRVATTAIVITAQDQIPRERTSATVQLGIQEDTAKQVW